jgi:hypothetical protein
VLETLGQSFLLNQIRKMVGAALATLRGCLAEGELARALAVPQRVHTPTAPELGLYLAECVFEAYNAQWRHSHGGVGIDEAGEGCVAAVAAFERDQVQRHIVETDASEGVFRAWIAELHERAARPPREEAEAGEAAQGAATGPAVKAAAALEARPGSSVQWLPRKRQCVQ